MAVVSSTLAGAWARSDCSWQNVERMSPLLTCPSGRYCLQCNARRLGTQPPDRSESLSRGGRAGRQSETQDYGLVMGPIYHAHERKYAHAILVRVASRSEAWRGLVAFANGFPAIGRCYPAVDAQELKQMLATLRDQGELVIAPIGKSLPLWACTKEHARSLCESVGFAVRACFSPRGILEGSREQLDRAIRGRDADAIAAAEGTCELPAVLRPAARLVLHDVIKST